MTLAAAMVIVYFYPHTEADSLNYEQGRPWNYAKLIAPFDIEIYPDSLTSRRLRDSLDAHYQPVFSINTSVADSLVAALPAGHERTRSLIAAKLRAFYRRGVVDNNIRQDITSGKLRKIRVPDDREHNVLNTMNTEALLSPVEIYRDLDATITDSAGRHYLSMARMETLLVPNVTLNQEENKKVYNSFLAQLEGARGVIQQGQTIIDKGMIITPQDYVNLQTYESKLATYHTKQTRHEYMVWIGQFMYVTILLATLLLYICNYCPEMMRTRRSILFLLLSITVPFLLCVGLDSVIVGGIYLVPMAIVPILVLVFFDTRTAIYVSLVLTLIAAGITSYPLEFIFLQFCATIGAVNSLRELRNRAQLLRTSLAVGACYIVSYLALELLMNGSFSGFSWRTVGFLAINSALTSVTYVMMFLVERVFGFVSVVTLVFISVKSRTFRTFFGGKPSLIIVHGKINYHEMVKQRYSLDDLLLSLRQKEIRNIEEVEYAFLEPNGKLSIFKYNFFKLKSDYPMPLIVDGSIQKKALKYIRKTSSWLEQELKSKKLDVKDVFYAFYKKDKIFLVKKSETLK